LSGFLELVSAKAFEKSLWEKFRETEAGLRRTNHPEMIFQAVRKRA
jgi:hypothetical protein